MGFYEAVIFDLDGTLLDTLEDLADGVNYVLNKHGYPRRTLEEIRGFVGNGVKSLLIHAAPEKLTDQQMNQCLTDFLNYYSGNLKNKTKPYEGIEVLLGELTRQGYKLAVVSNKFDAAVKELCQLYFEPYISIAVGESKNVDRKPAPDSVIAAVDSLDTLMEKAIFVGDSEIDVLTAKNAGIPCVGVTWGFRPKNALEEAGADYIIDQPQALMDILNHSANKMD